MGVGKTPKSHLVKKKTMFKKRLKQFAGHESPISGPVKSSRRATHLPLHQLG
jgi:hypothetical protein